MFAQHDVDPRPQLELRFLEISCAVTLDRLEVTLYVTLNVTLLMTESEGIYLLDHKDIRDIACTFDQTHQSSIAYLSSRYKPISIHL